MNENGIQVTALYVYQQLAEHQKICSRRWWWLLTTVIVGQSAILGFLFKIYLERHP